MCSQEEEEDEEIPGGGCRHGGGNGRWSPLRGARLEEMVREATRLAAQLEGCHLPPPAPGDPPGPAATPPGTPRSPRRQTFVVKDSPVRALLPTVESRGPAPTPRPPAKPRAASAATSVPKVGETPGVGVPVWPCPTRAEHPDPPTKPSWMGGSACLPCLQGASQRPSPVDGGHSLSDVPMSPPLFPGTPQPSLHSSAEGTLWGQGAPSQPRGPPPAVPSPGAGGWCPGQVRAPPGGYSR